MTTSSSLFFTPLVRVRAAVDAFERGRNRMRRRMLDLVSESDDASSPLLPSAPAAPLLGLLDALACAAPRSALTTAGGMSLINGFRDAYDKSSNDSSSRSGATPGRLWTARRSTTKERSGSGVPRGAGSSDSDTASNARTEGDELGR